MDRIFRTKRQFRKNSKKLMFKSNRNNLSFFVKQFCIALSMLISSAFIIKFLNNYHNTIDFSIILSEFIRLLKVSLISLYDSLVHLFFILIFVFLMFSSVILMLGGILRLLKIFTSYSRFRRKY